MGREVTGHAGARCPLIEEAVAGATQAGVRGEPLTRQLLTFGALLRGETRSGEVWD